MNGIKRFFFQALIWIVFTILLWNSNNSIDNRILKEVLQLGAQLTIVAVVIYFLSNQLFIKKRVGLFIGFATILILGLSLVTSRLAIYPTRGNLVPNFNRPFNDDRDRPPHYGFDRPPPNPPEADHFNHPPRGPKPPSLFWNMILLFSTTFSIAILWESAMFAIKKEEENIQNKAQHIQTELKLLKSQINPHFLFNSLNNIYALSVMDSNKTQQSISYLSDMLRYVLYECDQPLVPIQKEIEYINSYIRLFSLKSSKPYNINLNFDDKNTHTLLAPMLFIPFIENALKHGNIETRKEGFINISLKISPDKIIYVVENSVANTQKLKDEVGGIGLDNVKKRLDILYKNNHKLEVSEQQNSFKVQLTLHLK